MKRVILLLLTAALLSVALCACGSDAAFAKEDICLIVADTKITPETPVAEILSVLGEDYAYAEAVSCVYTGMDKTYTYEDAVLYTYPDADAERLMELYSERTDVKTAAGIAIGADKDAVIAQYGSDYTLTGSMLSYELPTDSSDYLPASLYFMLQDGKVTAIAITAEHRAE